MTIEPCALPFVFPDNVDEMTWEEKEELHKKFLRHGLTDNRKSLVENSPSELVYPGSPEYRRQMEERKRAIAELRQDEPFEVSRFEFDKEKGYLVEETPDTLADALARSNLEAEEIEKLTAPKATYREVSEKEIEERLRPNIKNDKGIH